MEPLRVDAVGGTRVIIILLLWLPVWFWRRQAQTRRRKRAKNLPHPIHEVWNRAMSTRKRISSREDNPSTVMGDEAHGGRGRVTDMRLQKDISLLLCGHFSAPVELPSKTRLLAASKLKVQSSNAALCYVIDDDARCSPIFKPEAMRRLPPQRGYSGPISR